MLATPTSAYLPPGTECAATGGIGPGAWERLRPGLRWRNLRHCLKGEPAMSPEENKEIVRRFVEEVWNREHLDLIDDLIAADYAGHDPSLPADVD
ncbi:MAG: hypothetical protein C4289_06685, partial [Chloroflexota bacterium]